MFATAMLSALLACGPGPSTNPSPDSENTPPDDEEPSTTSWLDLTYTTPMGADSPLARLDLYQRPGNDPQPLALLVHGGSWVGGDKSNFGGAAPDFRALLTRLGATRGALTSPSSNSSKRALRRHACRRETPRELRCADARQRLCVCLCESVRLCEYCLCVCV